MPCDGDEFMDFDGYSNETLQQADLKRKVTFHKWYNFYLISMCSPMLWSNYYGNQNTNINVVNITDLQTVSLKVKFISRQFEEESVLNGTVSKDDKSQAYSMQLQ